MEVQLSAGQTATVMDVDALRTGDKLAVQGEVKFDVQNGELQFTMALGEEMKVAVIAHCVSAWTLPDAPSVASVLKLPLADYDALCEATAPHRTALNVGADKS